MNSELILVDVDIRFPYHFWHLRFSAAAKAKGCAAIGLPHFLQPSRIFQCRYHQNEPCTLRSLSADSIKGKKVTSLKQHAKNMHSMLTPKHKKGILVCCNISLDILLVAVFLFSF